MNHFNPDEVGFRVNDYVCTYPHINPNTGKLTTANQIITDLVSYLALTVPGFNDVDYYETKHGTTWLAQDKSDLNIVNYNLKPGTKPGQIRYAARGWVVDVNPSHKYRQQRIEDLAEQLDIDIEVKLEAAIKPLISSYQEAINRVFPSLKEGSTVVLVVPTGCGKTAFMQTVGRTLRKKDITLLIDESHSGSHCSHSGSHFGTSIPKADTVVFIANPPFSKG